MGVRHEVPSDRAVPLAVNRGNPAVLAEGSRSSRAFLPSFSPHVRRRPGSQKPAAARTMSMGLAFATEFKELRHGLGAALVVGARRAGGAGEQIVEQRAVADAVRRAQEPEITTRCIAKLRRSSSPPAATLVVSRNRPCARGRCTETTAALPTSRRQTRPGCPVEGHRDCPVARNLVAERPISSLASDLLPASQFEVRTRFRRP